MMGSINVKTLQNVVVIKRTSLFVNNQSDRRTGKTLQQQLLLVAAAILLSNMLLMALLAFWAFYITSDV